MRDDREREKTDKDAGMIHRMNVIDWRKILISLVYFVQYRNTRNENENNYLILSDTNNRMISSPMGVM